MFKEGQLVRSRVSGWYGVVTTGRRRSFDVRMISGPHKGTDVYYLPQGDPMSELVGNNYKPKSLPEQRGCRKEDC